MIRKDPRQVTMKQLPSCHSSPSSHTLQNRNSRTTDVTVCWKPLNGGLAALILSHGNVYPM